MAITREDLMRAGIGTGGMNPNVIQVNEIPVGRLPAAAPAPMPVAPMPSQAAPQRQGLLGGFFGPQGRDARARLAIALEGMTLNPNQALIGQLQQGIEDRKAEAERNRTLEWLSTLNTPEAQRALQYAQATGDVVGAAKMALTPADPMDAINLEKARLELRRLQFGGVDPEKAFANEVELMKAYRTEPAVQAYNQLSGHYNTMLSAYNTTQTDPAAQGAGDLAMVYSYMKMLDPGSTVMQGEYASASNTSGVPDRVRNTYNAIIEGAGLTPSQRQAFLTQAGGMLQARAQPIAAINELYSGTAQRGGVQPNFLITPPPLPSFIPAVVPQSAVDLGVSQEDWNSMTQEERKEFMEGQ